MSKQKYIKFAIYDEVTNKPLKSLSRTEYKKKMLEIVKNILLQKESFKQRGLAVVKSECAEEWCSYVDTCLADLTNDWEEMWYNAVVIEAALNSMERLNKGNDLAISYRKIDVQEYGKDRIYFNMKLTGWQNYLATQLIYNYHDRGSEFLKYRNNFVKSPVKAKKKKEYY